MKYAAMTASKRERGAAGFREYALKKFFREAPGFEETLDFRILVDEDEWSRTSKVMYFPDQKGLVDMLWRSKVDIRPQDISSGDFLPVFSVAWPEMLIDGVQPVGCLIWNGTLKEWTGMADRYAKKYIEYDCRIAGIEDRWTVNVSFVMEDKTSPMGIAYYRLTVPDDFFLTGLAGLEDYVAGVGEFDRTGTSGIISMNDHERRVAYVTLKLATRLMIYMRACPEYVHEGFPDKKNAKAFGARWMNPTGRVIGSPFRMTGGTHDSPSVHLRSWYFRSYPVKRDGTRKDGIVFVREAIVGISVEPVTVESGGHLEAVAG